MWSTPCSAACREVTLPARQAQTRGARCRFGQFLGVGLSFQPETTGVADRHVTAQAEEAWESDRALPWATSVLSLSRRIGGKEHRPVVDALFRGVQ